MTRKSLIICIILITCVLLLFFQLNRNDKSHMYSPKDSSTELTKKESGKKGNKKLENKKMTIVDNQNSKGTEKEIGAMLGQQKNDNIYETNELNNDLSYPLYKILNHSPVNVDQLSQIARKMIAAGSSELFWTVIDAYRQIEKGEASIELLKAISTVKNPDLVSHIKDNINIAISDNDVSLLKALSDGLAHIDTLEATVALVEAVNANSQDDIPYIIEESYAKIRNTESMLLLRDVVDQTLPAYKGAMQSMMHMGESGVLQLIEIFNNNKGDDLIETFYEVIDKIEYDEEMYATFEKLENESSTKAEHEICSYALNHLDKLKY